MLGVNHRILHTVVNRCKMPSDGDIIVPSHTVAVIGTTDIPVADPDRLTIEPWEVQLLLEEGEKLVPGFKEMRILRAWAGVRPLYKDDTAPDHGANREISRSFALLDHEMRDGVSGLVTITGGKWTTYRKMAEATSDLVCKKLDVERPCRTHLDELPGAGHGHHRLGGRLAQIETKNSYGDLVCECELVTVKDVEEAILHGKAETIDDIRRDVRLGMGPCQGGYCTYRVAGILHTLRRLPVQATNAALRDFLKERWKGLLPILWGQQLRQVRLNQMIYISLFNALALPGEPGTRLTSRLYDPPTDKQPQQTKVATEQKTSPVILPARPENRSAAGPSVDVLVIGAGLAGLTSAWQAARKGKKVRVISKGMGSLYWNAGCIDVIDNSSVMNGSPATEIERLAQENPFHPYALAGTANVHAALESFKELCAAAGYPVEGSIEQNWLLPTAVGTLRSTCLAPATMIAGDMRPSNRQEPCLIVGFHRFLDFYPDLIAANLQALDIDARHILLDLDSLKKLKFVSSRSIGSLMETPEFREEFVRALLPHIGKAGRIGLPAVLGIDRACEVHHQLEAALGRKVFEIPMLPPSIPGIRLVRLLTKAIERLNGQVFDGMLAVSAQTDGEKVIAVYTEAAARVRPHRADTFILATGNILGGGISTTYDGKIKENIFGLPVSAPPDRLSWLKPDFLAPEGHPIFSSGIKINADFQPVGEKDRPLFNNLFCIGNALAGFDPIIEHSVDGIALVSGYLVGKSI